MLLTGRNPVKNNSPTNHHHSLATWPQTIHLLKDLSLRVVGTSWGRGCMGWGFALQEGSICGCVAGVKGNSWMQCGFDVHNKGQLNRCESTPIEYQRLRMLVIVNLEPSNKLSNIILE